MTHDLILAWRSRAAALEPYAPQIAHVLRECAQELEMAERAEALDSVSVAEAAVLSGYTANGLGGMIRRGEIENVGTKRRPRIRRRDVPRRPGHRTHGGVDVALLALAPSLPSRRTG